MRAEILRPIMSTHLLSSETVIHPWERKDLTETTYQYLFPPLKPGKVSLRHGTIIGLPECGKTEMLNDLAYHTRDFYGQDRVNIVFCDWLQDALDNMDARPVQLLMVDDSVKNANGRKSGGNADDVADYFEIRHEFERKARTRTGVIILIYVSQRFKSLDIVFRNAMYLWFKTATVDPDDKDIIKKYIGAAAFTDLERVSARMYYHHDDGAKERCIIHLPLEHRTGYFRSQMRERIIHMVGKQEMRPQEVFTFDRAAFIEQLLKEEKWRKAARCYKLSQNGLTYAQIGEDPEIDVNASRVSQLIARVRGELSLRSGTAYERWLVAQLETHGLTVQHDGKRGRPDIVATNVEKNETTVYSCKCLEFSRTVRMKRKELEPEILAAHRRKARLVLSVWNLWEMRGQEFTFDPATVPETIIIDPLTK